MSGSLNLGAVGRTLQRLVERDGRPLLLRDEATGLDHRLPIALVAAPDGLMPNFLAAANVVWRAATGRHLGIEQEHDPDQRQADERLVLEPGAGRNTGHAQQQTVPGSATRCSWIVSERSAVAR